MLNRRELKELIGKIIALIPVQNSVTRGVPLKEQIREFTLEKVGNKNFVISEGSYPIDGGDNKYNAGYKPFKNKQDALDHLEAISLTQELKRVSWSHLSLEEVKIIEDIVKDLD